MMTTYHQFEHDGKRYRFVYDEMHETEGSFAYGSDAEDRAAENHEKAMLQSGEWVALGCIVFERCDKAEHCGSCGGWTEGDSLWGIVIENSHEAAEEFARTSM